MVAETQAYSRELLEKDLSARHLVKSDFAMLNQKLDRSRSVFSYSTRVSRMPRAIPSA